MAQGTDQAEIELALGGMTCAACATRIERVLNRLPGIAATVNFASETAHVRLRPAASASGILSGLSPGVSSRTPSGTPSPASVARANPLGIGAGHDNEQVPIALRTDELIAAVHKAGYEASVKAAGTLIDHAAEQRLALRSFLIALALTLPLWIVMVQMVMGVHEWLPTAWQWVLATPVVFYSGARFYRGAWHALRGGAANMDVLIVLGTGIAWLYSSIRLLLMLGLGEGHGGIESIAILPGMAGTADSAAAATGRSPMAGGEPAQVLYFDSAASVVTLVLLGKWLESLAKVRTTAALTALVRMQPRTAWIESAQGLQEVPLSALAPGMHFVVRPGDSIAVDGEVIDGASSVNEAMLTGESMPVAKTAGAPVYAATINGNGQLRCKVTALGSATMLAGIIRLVSQAQGSKAAVQQLADRVSAVFVPVVIGIAIITLVIGWYWRGLDVALINAVAVLVIACPCALGLATPTALMVGIGRAAAAGILIRNATALEQAGEINLLLLDKTGTLTEGAPAVVEVEPVAGSTVADLMRLAVSLENPSEHPLARAVVRHATELGVNADAVSNFVASPGGGLSASLDGKIALAGSIAFLRDRGVTIDESSAAAMRSRGVSVIGYASGGQLRGLLGLADKLRDSSPRAIARLKAMGIKPVLLSGDHIDVANAVAREAGIEEVRAGMKPADKAAEVALWRSLGYRVGMVGDGINDAPALAAADVGFAMTGGTGAAIDAADITLMRGDLSSLPDAIDLSRRTRTRIRQNLAFAFGYNILGIPLAAFGLLSPTLAGAAMAASSISVVGNALLLNRWKPGDSK